WAGKGGRTSNRASTRTPGTTKVVIVVSPNLAAPRLWFQGAGMLEHRTAHRANSKETREAVESRWSSHIWDSGTKGEELSSDRPAKHSPTRRCWNRRLEKRAALAIRRRFVRPLHLAIGVR